MKWRFDATLATMYAIQGAMAIRRQRQMRENRRMSQVKMSTKKGSTSTPRGSDAAASVGDAATTAAVHFEEPKGPPKTETSQTAFYLGVVFILVSVLSNFFRHLRHFEKARVFFRSWFFEANLISVTKNRTYASGYLTDDMLLGLAQKY